MSRAHIVQVRHWTVRVMIRVEQGPRYSRSADDKDTETPRKKVFSAVRILCCGKSVADATAGEGTKPRERPSGSQNQNGVESGAPGLRGHVTAGRPISARCGGGSNQSRLASTRQTEGLSSWLRRSDGAGRVCHVTAFSVC